MRRSTLVLAAAAALLLPAAAAAHGRGHGHGHHRGHRRAAVVSVLTFRPVRAHGPHAPSPPGLAFGCRTGGKGGHGRAPCRGVRLLPSPRKELLEFASGTISSFGASGCTTCVVAASGSVEGAPIAHGSFSASLTAVWSRATPNGSGGHCAPTSGTITLSDGTNTIVESVSGTLCELGAGGSGAGHVFVGRTSVTSGTGTYAGAHGAGRLGFYQPSGSSSITGVERSSLAPNR